ncbi:MAG: hypothetical protein IPI85_07115 [Dehalococcoidia bacterium]|nr:hypothetical protein [Dehalococcoidia bacterium]
MDHGIETPEERRAAGKPETGTVTVTAWNQETYIYLSVKDDGKGIDTRTLRAKSSRRDLCPATPPKQPPRNRPSSGSSWPGSLRRRPSPMSPGEASAWTSSARTSSA